MDVQTILRSLTQSAVVLGGLNYVLPRVAQWLNPAGNVENSLLVFTIISLSIWIGGVIARAIF